MELVCQLIRMWTPGVRTGCNSNTTAFGGKRRSTLRAASWPRFPEPRRRSIRRPVELRSPGARLRRLGGQERTLAGSASRLLLIKILQSTSLACQAQAQCQPRPPHHRRKREDRRSPRRSRESSVSWKLSSTLQETSVR